VQVTVEQRKKCTVTDFTFITVCVLQRDQIKRDGMRLARRFANIVLKKKTACT